MSEKQVPAAAPAASPASGGPPTYGQINRVDGPPANANANDGSSYDTEANTYRADGHGPGGRRESTDVKAANGPGPADPYYHDEKGRPIIMEDELRVAGVKRIEAISAQLGPKARALTFFGIFLFAYAYGLDGINRYTYQGYATGAFGQHSVLTTIGVVRAVVGAAAQPTGAKLTDVFGRLELLLVSIVLYVVGTIVMAATPNVFGLAGGAVIYEVGYTLCLMLVQVIIGDLSSLKTRVFFSFIPTMPFLINAWIGPNVLAATVGELGERSWMWRWGFGMWAIIFPVASILLIVMLSYAQIRAKRHGALVGTSTAFQTMGVSILPKLFWQLDIVGILLLIIAFGFFLTPFTLAGGSVDPASTWATAKILAPLIIGLAFFPVLAVWEMKCRYPLIPLHLLKDRGVWAGFLVALTLNWAWSMQFIFAYPVLLISFNQAPRNAAYIQNIYTFVSTLTGIIIGAVVVRVRRLKGFIVFGCCLFLVSFGLLIRFRGNPEGGEVAGYIAAEVLLGMGAGMFSFPTQASVQARTKHAHLAVVTGLYLAAFRIGSAIGNAVSGAVWTYRMLPTLTDYIGNATIAASFYSNPYVTVLSYPLGTPERTGAILAYRDVQRILAIIGICLCVPLIVWSLLLRDPVLTEEQSLATAEEDDNSEIVKVHEKRKGPFGWFKWN